MTGLRPLPIHVLGSSAPTPTADRVIYVDGSAPPSVFRPDVDLELSHWVPTTTPARWAADTSTETCLRFLADPPDDVDGYGLAVNNHVDVDGILSLFVLAHPDVAVAHAEVLVGAAEMADLAAWAEWPSFRLAQELTVLMGGFGGPGSDPLDVYRDAFALVPRILTDDHPAPAVVQRGWELVSVDPGGEVVGPRFVAFGQTGDPVVPTFNPLVDDSMAVWPHARNRHHAEALHLVSTRTEAGWLHDLWLPGYVWAHTPDRWRPPITEGPTGGNTWRVRTEVLAPALATLRADERNEGSWAVADEVDPFAALPGRGFPVIVSFVDDDGAPTVSTLAPDDVAAHLAPALQED